MKFAIQDRSLFLYEFDAPNAWSIRIEWTGKIRFGVAKTYMPWSRRFRLPFFQVWTYTSHQRMRARREVYHLRPWEKKKVEKMLEGTILNERRWRRSRDRSSRESSCGWASGG